MDTIITSYCLIRDNTAIVNGRLACYQENILTFADFIKTVFRQEQVSYPKFFKMDAISKLGFLATELALKERPVSGYKPESVGAVFANSSSSLETDMAHQETIRDRSGYFPSPSVFVYTLPNIVIGEICIRHRIKGENAFLLSENFDARMLVTYVSELFEQERVEACLCGWVEVLNNRYCGMTALVEKAGTAPSGEPGFFQPVAFNEMNLNYLLKRI
ncbi:MAG TPA: hypothetical protein PKG48_12715 [Bacteroidales bacterium]|nr:hypothetical protein [Bacteroidales bacterium]